MDAYYYYYYYFAAAGTSVIKPQGLLNLINRYNIQYKKELITCIHIIQCVMVNQFLKIIS